MLQVLPFVSILGGTSHHHNVVVNPDDILEEGLIKVSRKINYRNQMS